MEYVSTLCTLSILKEAWLRFVLLNPMTKPAVSSFTRFSCWFMIISTSAAAPRLRPLQLLLPDCICFSCCSLIVSASAVAPRLCPLQLLLPDCVPFSCCSLIASASAVAPRLCPLQLLLPDCVRFSCCSLIAAACDYTHASTKYSKSKVMGH